jgi:3-hydroxyisobutyrate dehydrogenase-like beta-hydroxyacid dehydrogenase
MKTIGFLGLGLMGSRMAKNLATKGFTVHAWNRTPGRVADLAPLGVIAEPTPRALAAKVDAYCTCVADPAALREVALGTDGLLAGAKKGQLFIDFSTVSGGLTRQLEADFGAKGIDFAEAPVTGSKNGAEKGTLVIMTGCTDATFARCKPIFEAVGEKAIHCGPVGAATAVKLSGNALIAAMLQAFSEGMLMCAKAGVDPRKLVEVVQASGFRSPYFEFKGKALLERDFSTHFTIDLMHKDLGLFLEAAAQNQVPTPTAASLRETYNFARSSGKGAMDIGAVITAYEDVVGVKIH